MHNPMMTLHIDLTPDQAAFGKGRSPVVGPFTLEEFTDLLKLLGTVDSFVEAASKSLLLVRQALETGQPAPVEAVQGMIALTQPAQDVAQIMGAIRVLMGRFSMVTSAPAEKERLQ